MTVLVSTHYMDEAERCHELVYIADGEVLTRGTQQSIIDGSGLAVWSVEGPELAALADDLKPLPGVLSVAAFGNALHVAGRDALRLDASLAPYRERSALRWQRTEPNLEDVFINLLSREAQAA